MPEDDAPLADEPQPGAIPNDQPSGMPDGEPPDQPLGVDEADPDDEHAPRGPESMPGIPTDGEPQTDG